MPYTRLVVHAVWSVKERKPLMTIAHKEAMCQHILEYAAGKNIQIITINGWRDHLHCLISLSSNQNMATVMNL